MIPSAVAVRLIRERSGESRGFAFVEFASVHDAQKFVEGGSVRLGGRVLYVEYSRGHSDSHPKMDWVCNVNGCDGFNFARRTSCFQCGAQKDPTFATHLASDDTRDPHRRDIYDSNVPSSVLVVRGLDASLEEDAIRFAFQGFGAIKEVRLVRDKVTNQSRGFCFVSFQTVDAATEALAGSVGLRIGESNVRVSYSAESRDNRSGLIPGQRKKGGPPPKRPANIAPTFVYDDATGYWFDQTSRFYYNDTTQLYYHSDSGIYYRWDVGTGTYVQTDERGVLMSTVKEEEALREKKKKIKQKKESTEEISEVIPDKKPAAPTIDKQALLGSIKFSLKSVNTDLVRWKKLKDEQDAEKKRQEEAQKAAVVEEQQRIAERAQADLERSAAVAAITTASQAPSQEAQSAEAAEDDDNAKGELEEGEADSDEPKRRDKWLDYKRLACLLCQRQFKTVEILHKHCDKSDLHKKNLQIQEFKQIHKTQREATQTKIQKATVDKKAQIRAFEFQEMVEKAKSKEIARKAREEPIDGSNVGNRLLKKMGWTEGEGLGKDGDGILDPVQAEIRNSKAGIGMAGASAGANDSYQGAARARYERAMPSTMAAPSAEASKAYLAMMNAYNSSKCNEDDVNRPMLK